MQRLQRVSGFLRTLSVRISSRLAVRKSRFAYPDTACSQSNAIGQPWRTDREFSSKPRRDKNRNELLLHPQRRIQVGNVRARLEELSVFRRAFPGADGVTSNTIYGGYSVCPRFPVLFDRSTCICLLATPEDQGRRKLTCGELERNHRLGLIVLSLAIQPYCFKIFDLRNNAGECEVADCAR